MTDYEPLYEVANGVYDACVSTPGMLETSIPAAIVDAVVPLIAVDHGQLQALADSLREQVSMLEEALERVERQGFDRDSNLRRALLALEEITHCTRMRLAEKIARRALQGTKETHG